MNLKKLLGKLHLILGLASGSIVFVIAITGCVYAFQAEIKSAIENYRYVTPQNKPFLLPSQLKAIADEQLPGKHAHGVTYSGAEKASRVSYYSVKEGYYDLVYINQYTGEVLKVKDEKNDFFRWVLEGHFYLWLPHEIGQPVVASATLVFVFMLISGLYLWWPRNKNGTRQRFTIKWDARWRRKNYDLHNVLGFYVSWFAIILALTGLVWGFKWFAGGVYAIASGGKELKPFTEPLSDTSKTYAALELPATDKLWLKMKAENPEAASIEVHFPESSSSSIEVAINPDPSTIWKYDILFFNQYSLKELPSDQVWGRFEKASAADLLMRMNYDIHIGAIGGIFGKILAFIVSLFVASLPVTGVIIWIGRRKKSRKSTHSVNKQKEKAELVLEPEHVRMECSLAPKPS